RLAHLPVHRGHCRVRRRSSPHLENYTSVRESLGNRAISRPDKQPCCEMYRQTTGEGGKGQQPAAEFGSVWKSRGSLPDRQPGPGKNICENREKFPSINDSGIVADMCATIGYARRLFPFYAKPSSWPSDEGMIVVL